MNPNMKCHYVFQAVKHFFREISCNLELLEACIDEICHCSCRNEIWLDGTKRVKGHSTPNGTKLTLGHDPS